MIAGVWLPEVLVVDAHRFAVDIELVRRALSLPLPGLGAQMAMSPRRPAGMALPSRYLDGGVLVLLYPRNGELAVILTRRCDHLAAHAGQISFPGGLREAQDVSFAATALRETQEELGLDPAGLALLGPLSSLEIPVSGYRIHPWVAYSPVRPAFRPDPGEVAELIEVPIGHFLAPTSVECETRTIRGQEVEVPFYRVGVHKVWGATAMVLCELAALLRAAGAGL